MLLTRANNIKKIRTYQDFCDTEVESAKIEEQ